MFFKSVIAHNIVLSKNIDFHAKCKDVPFNKLKELESVKFESHYCNGTTVFFRN